MLRVHVDHEIHLPVTDLEDADIDPRSILKSFSHDNPVYHRKRAMGYWTGHDEPQISLATLTRSVLSLPRGAWRRLAAFLDKRGVRYLLKNSTTCGTNTGAFQLIHEPPFNLREDQLAAVRACLDGRQGVVVAPCGAGKTTIAARLMSKVNEKSLVLVHTEQLLKQWGSIISTHMSAKPGYYYGKEKSDGPVVVGMMQSASKVRDQAWFDQFGLVVVDECFPAGTMIDNRPIETIEPGDQVWSYDEQTRTLSKRRVLNVWKSTPKYLIRLVLHSGPIVCTPGHPFLTKRGWVPAGALQTCDMVLCSMYHEKMQRLQTTVQSETPLGPQMQGVCDQSVGSIENLKGNGVSDLREHLRNSLVARPARPQGALSKALLTEVLQRADAANKFLHGQPYQHLEARPDSRADAAPEPNEGPQYQAQGVRGFGCQEMGSTMEGRQRNRTDKTTGIVSNYSRYGDGGRYTDRASDACRLSNLLQGRPCGQRSEAGDRSRRQQPQGAEPFSQRPEEGAIFEWVGVDCVEVLEPGSDGTFGGLCPDRKVYNLHVEESETYLVNGAVVHNCHHAPCQTMAKIIARCPAKYRIGLTATPNRKDGMEFLLWDLFGWDLDQDGKPTPRVLYRITDAHLSENRSVMPVDVVVVPTDYDYPGDLRELGEYSKMMDDLTSDPDRTGLAVGMIMKEAKAGKRCLVLSDRRALCMTVHAVLSSAGINAGLMMGGDGKQEAEETISGLKDGSIQVGIGTTVADEGLDIKELECGFGLTPAANNPGRFIQQFGRLKRMAPGKNSATYFYLWDRKIGQFSGHASAIRRMVEPPHRTWIVRPDGTRSSLKR